MRVQGLHQESKPFQDSHKQRHKSSVGPIGVARSSPVTRAISSLKLRMGLKPRACCATNFEELSHPSRCHCWAPLRKLFWLNPYSRRCSSVLKACTGIDLCDVHVLLGGLPWGPKALGSHGPSNHTISSFQHTF